EADLVGELHIIGEQLVHLLAELPGAHDGGKLAVVLDAAVIEIGGPDDRRVLIDHHGLGVKNHALAFVYFYAGAEEKLVERSAAQPNRRHIAMARQHEAHAHAALGGFAKPFDQWIVRREIGHRHQDAFACLAKQAIEK